MTKLFLSNSLFSKWLHFGISGIDFKAESSRRPDKCRKIIISESVKLKMAKKGKSQKVAPKEQSDADTDQAAGAAGDKKGKKVKTNSTHLVLYM